MCERERDNSVFLFTSLYSRWQNASERGKRERERDTDREEERQREGEKERGRERERERETGRGLAWQRNVAVCLVWQREVQMWGGSIVPVIAADDFQLSVNDRRLQSAREKRL